jgi:hypothetical protein
MNAGIDMAYLQNLNGLNYLTIKQNKMKETTTVVNYLTIITKKQYDSLTQSIYDTLMENPDFGLGERGECRDEAARIVDDWMEDNGIQNEDEQ